MDTRVVGVDLGGTRMRVAILDREYRLYHRVEEPTRAQEGPDASIPRLLNLIGSVLDQAEGPIAAIGISAQPARLGWRAPGTADSGAIQPPRVFGQ